MSTIIPASPLKTRAAFFLRKFTDTNTATAAGVLGIANAVRALVESIGWPLQYVRTMSNRALPIVEDYTDMVAETAQDLTTVQTALPDLAQQGVDLANYSEAQYATLREQLGSVGQEVATLRAQARSELRSHIIGTGKRTPAVRRQGQSFVETYASDKQLDYGKCRNILFVPAAEAVTLQRVTDISLAPHAVVVVNIIDPVNGELIGFPGNTLELEQTMASLVPTHDAPHVTYVGGANAHADPTALLDDRSDTWFEFERNAVYLKQPMTKMGDAWVYNTQAANQEEVTQDERLQNGLWLNNAPASSVAQAVFGKFITSPNNTNDVMGAIAPDKWEMNALVSDGQGQKEMTVSRVGAPHDGRLTLTVTCLFLEPRTLNYIDIMPYLPERARKTPAQIAKISLIDRDGVRTLFDGATKATTTLSTNLVFPVENPKPIYGVQFDLVQPNSYSVLLGHPWVVAVVKTVTKKTYLWVIHDNKTAYTHQRLETPKQAMNLVSASSNAGTMAAIGALAGVSAALSVGAAVAIGSAVASAAGLGSLLAGSAVLGPIGVAAALVVGVLAATGLYSKKVIKTVEEVLTGDDIFKGERWAIGVRGLGMRQIHYATDGVCVSKPYVFTDPVSAVSLRGADATAPGLTNIAYEVSVNGTTWLPIVGDGSVTEFAKPTSRVYVRTSLARRDADTNDVSLTPVLRGYELQGYFA